MHSRAVSLSFEPYVLGAVHHRQKWNASSFTPWHFEHKALPRMSGIVSMFVMGVCCRYPADQRR